MPNPSGREYQIVDPVLTGFTQSFIAGNAGLYAASSVFPVVPVADQEGKYYVFDDDNFFTMYAAPRAPDTESEGGRYKLTSGTFSTSVWAVHKDITREDAQKASRNPAVGDPFRRAANFVANQLLLTREYEFAAKFFVASTWTGSTTGGDITPGTLWSDANSTPIEDIQDQSNSIEDRTGFKANTLILGRDVETALIRHPDIRESLAANERAIVTADMLPSLLGVERVRTLRPVRNTAGWNLPGNRTYMYNKKSALLAYTNPDGTIDLPSAGYIFAWTGLLGAGAYAPSEGGVTREQVPLRKTIRVEGEMAFGMFAVAPRLAAFFLNVVA